MRAALPAPRLPPALPGAGRRGPAPVKAGPVHLVKREETDDGGIMFTFGDGPAPAAAAPVHTPAAPVGGQPAVPPSPPPPPPQAASRGAAVAAAATPPAAHHSTSLAHHSRAELEALKVADLKKLAASAGVKGASKLKKAELVEALLQ